jgi:Cell wall-active antibiotics response 4TMS YvqF
VAIFSGADRRGRWLVEHETNVVVVCGGVELDLRQAVLSRREVTINVVNIMGGVNLTVPPGVRVTDSISSVFGGTSLDPEEGADPDAPVIRLTGLNLMGGVSVKRRAVDGGDLSGRPNPRALHDEQRRLHREFRHKQREIHREFRDQQRELRRRRHGG